MTITIQLWQVIAFATFGVAGCVFSIVADAISSGPFATHHEPNRWSIAIGTVNSGLLGVGFVAFLRWL